MRAKIDKAIEEKKEILIYYKKYNGEVSCRSVSNLEYSKEYGDDYIYGYCHLRNDWRTFKISRILDIQVL